MQTIVTFIAVLVLVVGIYISRKDTTKTIVSSPATEVLSESNEKKDDKAVSSNVNVNIDDKESSTPTPISTKVPTPSAKPTSEPKQNRMNLSDYIYPASNIISSSENNLKLQSSDDPGKITDWYKDKIKSLGLNINTFVTTNANDKILNKLVGARSDTKISVEISRDNANQKVLISVKLE